MKGKKRGGERPNSGRKPVKDKKIQLAVYVRESIISEIGGLEAAKESVLEYLGANSE